MESRYDELPEKAYCGEYCYKLIPIPKRRWWHGQQYKKVWNIAEIFTKSDTQAVFHCKSCGKNQRYELTKTKTDHWIDADRTMTGVEEYWECRFDCRIVPEKVRLNKTVAI